MNRILYVFLDVDARSQHLGLSKIAATKSINTDKLKKNEHVIFINKKRDKIKVISHEGIMTYKKSMHGPLDLMAIEHIAQCFNEDSSIDWTKAQQLALEKALEKKSRTRQ